MATQEKKKEAPVPAAPKAPQTKTVVELVADRVQGFIASKQLFLPKDYSPDNALKSAWLALQDVEDKDHRPALQVCTTQSIANALLDMIVQGLNPMKKQGYFIVYGKTLTFQRSYFGAMAVAQMVDPTIGEFAYAVVYEGDTFKYGIQNGKKAVTLHEQDIKNVNKSNIVGAYCIAIDKTGNPMRTEIMTFDEIKMAWSKSKTRPFDDAGNLKASSTHGQFTADMAMKTVINKLCKFIINASSDNALLLERINRNEEMADTAAVQAEITDKANTGSTLMIGEQPQIQELQATNEKMGEMLKEAGIDEDGVVAEPQPSTAPICVCSDFIAQKSKEWDCPVHGRYQGGIFNKPDTPFRKPGF